MGLGFYRAVTRDEFEDLEELFVNALECNQKVFAIGD